MAHTPDESALVATILQDYAKAYAAKRPKEALFRSIYMRYRSYLEVYRTTSRSTLFIPESFALVETIAPRMVAQKPTFRVLPRDTDDIATADGVGQLLDYFYDRTKIHRHLKVFTKQALMYGTSPMKIGWDTDNEIPTHDPLDIADLFGDPETYDWQTGFLIHRYYMTLDELKRSKVKYQHLDLLMNRKDTRAQDDTMRQERMSIQGIPYDSHRSGIEILEYWNRDEKGAIKVRALADRSVLIRDDNNPNPLDRYPFVVLYDQEVPFERWGIGEIEPIMDLQDEENTTRNQRIDEKNLSIHNMWVVSKLAGIDYKTIISKPGGIILANDINGIRELQKQNITQDSLAELNLIKQDIESVSGVNDFIRGLNQHRTSATQASLQTQEANQRFAEKINNLEIALKEIGEWDVALAAEFMTTAIQMRISGKFGVEIKKLSKKDIQGGYDIDIETGSSLPANPDLRRQQLTQLTQLLVPVLSNPAGISDGVRELLRSVIQSFDLKNTDEILQSAHPPQVNQAMANLHPDELQGTNPQMVEAEIKRLLTGSGALSGQSPQQQTGGAPQSQAPQQPMAQMPGQGHP